MRWVVHGKYNFDFYLFSSAGIFVLRRESGVRNCATVLGTLMCTKNVSGLQVQVRLVSDQRYTTGAHKVAASVCGGSMQLAAYV